MPRKARSEIPQAPTLWLTLLTVRIDVERSSFAPSFHCKPFAGKKHAIRCSCSQIRSWNLRDPLPALVRQFPIECNTPRFVFYDSTKAKKAKDLCNRATEYNDTKSFLPRMCRLLHDLSKVCEGKKSPDPRRKLGDTNLRPFRSDRLEKEFVSEELRRKLCLPLNPSEVQDYGLGYVYILRSQSFSTLAEFKIGFSKYHPEHRAHELARCLKNPEVVGHTPLLPRAKRIELIVHTELTACRKVQFCAQCQRHHKEWFTIAHIDARDVVTRWSRWMLQRPYRDGVLTKQWRDYLAAQDFSQAEDRDSLEELWSDVVDNYPTDESEGSKAEQIGSYINAIHSERMTRFALNSLGLQPPRRNFEEGLQKLRNIRSKYTDGLGLPVPKLVDPGQELFDNGLTPNGRRLRQDTLKGSQPRQAAMQKEGKDFIDHLRSIKTGCMSVSDEELGISESPLGDATMLPIVQLRELEYVDSVARNWIGYNPTHARFQFLQEAYQERKWYGTKPRFKRPKVFHDLEKSRKARRMGRETDDSTSPRLDEPAAPSFVEPTGQAPPEADHPAESTPSQFDSHDTNARGEVEFIPGRKGERSKLQFSQPITPEFIERLNATRDRIRNGGRAEVERELKKGLAYYGVDACAPDSDEESSSEEESDESSEGEALEQSVEKPSFEGARPQDGVEGTSTGFSRRAAGKWLGSL